MLLGNIKNIDNVIFKKLFVFKKSVVFKKLFKVSLKQTWLFTILFCSAISIKAEIATIDFRVVDEGCKEFAVVKKLLDTVIAKWYGNQEKFLNKIIEDNDRFCEILFCNNEPKGIIVFKKKLQEKDLFECKTLCLFNPKEDSGKGYGSILLKRLACNANMRNAEGIILTCSEKNPAINFFIHNGFKFVDSFVDKYIKGEKEYSLVLNKNGIENLLKKRHTIKEGGKYGK